MPTVYQSDSNLEIGPQSPKQKLRCENARWMDVCVCVFLYVRMLCVFVVLSRAKRNKRPVFRLLNRTANHTLSSEQRVSESQRKVGFMFFTHSKVILDIFFSAPFYSSYSINALLPCFSWLTNPCGPWYVTLKKRCVYFFSNYSR